MRRALVLTLLLGCSKIVGINDVTLGDAGTDGGAPPNTVVGKSSTRCTTPAGTVEVPIDNSQTIIQALIPEGTGYRVVDGVGLADGTFTIAEVPDGLEYVLKIGRAYFVTTVHTIDHHFEQPSRCEPKPAFVTSTTTVNFAVSNMQSFKSSPEGVSDSIEVNSFNLLYLGNIALPNGATTTTVAFDWGTDGIGLLGGGVPLVDAAQGDDLHVIHLRTESVAGSAGRKHSLTRVVDLFSPTGITITDAATTTIAGSFTPAPLNKTLNAQMIRGQYDAGYDGTSQFAGANISIFGHPVVNDFGIGVTLANFDLSDWSRSASLTETIGFMYSDPLPAAFARMLNISYTRNRFLLFPGTTVARPNFAFYQRQLELPSGNPSLQPTLLPPGGAKVASIDFGLGGKIAFDGVTPVPVTWNAVAGAKQYQVNVSRVFANGNQTRTQFAGSITTTSTSVQIPAEIFTGGEFFSFTLLAIQAPADYEAGQLIANGIPNQFAPTPSGMFRMSANCGNGTVDLGEDCDTSGETAACDVDCTARSCGDGLRNATAGEMCDTIFDTSGCDADCTLPACGDNHPNFVLEDCDDGNITDENNGCSGTCKFNNTCGDGQVQNQVESCDTGGDSAACDNDCTLAECADGHLNTVAGEQCDDGNFEINDGCVDCVIN